MTDYNDGKWHGWNGGECPVHPKSGIEAQYVGGNGRLMHFYNEAAGKDWNGVFLFRVIKKYREPRECWSYGTIMHNTLADAEKFRADVAAANPGKGYGDGPITHWVEVLP